MQNSHSDSYKAAGVDITAGYEAVRLMREHVARTAMPGVLSGLGGFGGLFELNLSDTPNPVLVSGTDGVGTKLRIAFVLDRHDTVGIDCVAMCVNDIICCGARPQIFLDYIACGKNVPRRIAALVAGVAEGCVRAGCALVGGETAEMPGFYPENEYDIAGFAVGVVDKAKILDNSGIRPGDAVIALPSSGVHSNGFSLIRRVFGLGGADDTAILAGQAEVLGRTLGETLLEPTKIYVKPVLKLLESVAVLGISHITGGGFYENIPRCLPAGLSVSVDRAALQTPPIFGLIGRAGDIPERDMFNTFNMGVGMCLVVSSACADEAVRILRGEGESAYFLGEIIAGGGGVDL